MTDYPEEPLQRRAEGGEKKIVIILNRLSSRKKFFYRKIMPSIVSTGNVEVFETRSSDDAFDLASGATADGADALIAAGGDGTLHQVVNGVLQGREHITGLPAVGLVPLGSANDFARTVNVRRSPGAVRRLLKEFRPQLLDVGKVTFQEAGKSTHYFINIADTGLGPYVADRINKSRKVLGAGMSYYAAILKTFITYKPVEVRVQTESWNWSGKIRALVVANGKCFGHGLYVAPDARADDGKFEVFIAEDVSVFDFIRYTGRLKKGKKINHPKIQYRQARELEITSPSTLLAEADGEVIGQLPVRMEVLSKRLPFLF